MKSIATLLALAAAAGSASAFSAGRSAAAPLRSPALPRAPVDAAALRPSSSALGMSAFDPIKEPVQSYVDIWTPLFAQAKEAGLAPDFLLHWGHGAAMATVLLTMGTIGAYMGWQIRLGNGNEVTALTLGETIREAHPKIIFGALFFFLLGGQGGLVLLATQGGSILESPHAITAAIAVGMMLVQAALPKLFATENGQLARDAHAYLGSATMVALFAHLATGIKLGLSF
ncbi:hypothetical protein ACHAXT_004233 [Thalassiosira profunda]